jgi:molybdenum cofactor cytidylyltransferase
VNACVVLAAGASRRLGTPKQLLDLGGRPLLCWALNAAREFAPLHTVLVLGHDEVAIRLACDLRGITVITNDRHAEGMSTSLNAGIEALPAAIESVTVITGDQPFVSVDHLRSLVTAYVQSGQPIVATKYADHSGVPLLLSREIWPLIAGLSGDQGARGLLREHSERVLHVSAQSDMIGLDVDTWDAYERAKSAALSQTPSFWSV